MFTYPCGVRCTASPPAEQAARLRHFAGMSVVNANQLIHCGQAIARIPRDSPVMLPFRKAYRCVLNLGGGNV